VKTGMLRKLTMKADSEEGKTMMDFITLAQERYSVRKFSEKAV